MITIILCIVVRVTWHVVFLHQSCSFFKWNVAQVNACSFHGGAEKQNNAAVSVWPCPKIFPLRTRCRFVVAFLSHPVKTRTDTRAITWQQHGMSSRICFEVPRTPSNTRADLLNLEIQPYLLPSDNLNATFLPLAQKEKNIFCVCVAWTQGNSIAQQKSCGGKSPCRHYMSASPPYC